MSKHRYFLDANVVISGLLWKGNERMLLESGDEGKVALVTSVYVLREVEDVLKRMNFDEDKVVAEIKHNYPTWSDERVYDEVDKLDDIYEDKRSNKVEPIVETTVKECLTMVEKLQKEVKA